MEKHSLENQAKNIVMEKFIKIAEKIPIEKELANSDVANSDEDNEYYYWEEISKNPNLTIEWIEKYPDKNWNWKEISKNLNLTIEFVDKYHDKDWNWNRIARHPFKKEYEKELQKLKNFNNIEEELIEKTWHPSRFQDWCLDEDEKEEE